MTIDLLALSLLALAWGLVLILGFALIVSEIALSVSRLRSQRDYRRALRDWQEANGIRLILGEKFRRGIWG